MRWFNCNRPVLACLILGDFGIKGVLQAKQIRGMNPLSITLANLVAMVFMSGASMATSALEGGPELARFGEEMKKRPVG